MSVARPRNSPQVSANTRKSSLTPEERTLRARVAAHASWGNTDDRSARTANARAASLDRFLKEAGGDPVKAEHLKKAYFGGLALKSAIARRRAKELTQVAEQAEAELAGGGAA